MVAWFRHFSLLKSQQKFDISKVIYIDIDISPSIFRLRNFDIDISTSTFRNWYFDIEISIENFDISNTTLVYACISLGVAPQAKAYRTCVGLFRFDVSIYRNFDIPISLLRYIEIHDSVIDIVIETFDTISNTSRCTLIRISLGVASQAQADRTCSRLFRLDIFNIRYSDIFIAIFQTCDIPMSTYLKCDIPISMYLKCDISISIFRSKTSMRYPTIRRTPTRPHLPRRPRRTGGAVGRLGSLLPRQLSGGRGDEKEAYQG